MNPVGQRRNQKKHPMTPQRREGRRDRRPENLCALPASAVNHASVGVSPGFWYISPTRRVCARGQEPNTMTKILAARLPCSWVRGSRGESRTTAGEGLLSQSGRSSTPRSIGVLSNLFQTYFRSRKPQRNSYRFVSIRVGSSVSFPSAKSFSKHVLRLARAGAPSME